MLNRYWLTLAIGLIGFALPLCADEPIPIAQAGVTGAAIHVPSISTARPSRDPFPIHRVYVPQDRFAAAIKQLQPGPVVRLPCREFEARVQAATQTLTAPAPRLLETRYRAINSAEGLKGVADWRLQTGAAGQLFTVEPLKGSVNLTNSSGVLFTTKSETPTLYLVKAGDNTVSFDWSVRGIEEPTLDRFELAFPPCPIATLELDLPTDRLPSLSGANHLLTGPLPGTQPNRQVWLVSFGGQSRLDLAIRKPKQANEPRPLLRVNRKSEFKLTPNVVNAAFELSLDPARTFPLESVIECDPRLRISSVTGSSPVTWRAEPETPGQPSRLRVSHQESNLNRITVNGFCGLPRDTESGWAAPIVRVNGAFVGTDTITVICNPELKWLGADPGDYRVINAYEEQGYHVMYTGSLLPNSNGQERRPVRIRVQTVGTEYTSTEEFLWEISSKPKLSAKLKVNVTHGPLLQLPVTLPPNFVLMSATTIPQDLELAWTVSPSNPNTILFEPAPTVGTGQTFELNLELQDQTEQRLPMRRTFDFPVLQLPGAQERDGVLTIHLAPGLQAWASVNLTPSSEDAKRLRFPYRTELPRSTLSVSIDSAIGSDLKSEPIPSAILVKPPLGQIAAQNASEWQFSKFDLLTRLESNGRQSVILVGRILRAGDRNLSVTLPASAELQGVQFAGRAVDHAELRSGDDSDGPGFSFPLPAIPPDGLPIELRYQLPNLGRSIWPVQVTPIMSPKLLGDSEIVSRWTLAPEYRRWPRLDSPSEPVDVEVTSLTAIPTSVLLSIGLVLAVIVAGVGSYLVLHCGQRRCRWLFVLCIGVIGVALWLLPQGWEVLLRPGVVVGMVVFTVLLVSRSRKNNDKNRSGPVSTSHGSSVRTRIVSAVGVMMGWVAFGFGSPVNIAQAPEPVTVLLTSGDANTLGVVVAQATIDQLDTLARSTVPGVVMTEAEYDVTCEKDKASISAKFNLVCYRSGEHRFVLPLGGIRLESLELDSQPAYADGTKPDQYTITISNPGSHSLTARFVVPVVTTGVDREMKFMIPDHVSSRVQILAMSGASLLDCPTRHGTQSVTTQGDRLRLQVDHGAGRSLVLRWHQWSPTSEKATVIASEMNVWDLAESETTLNSAFQYSVEGRGLSQVSFEIPPGLEVGTPILRSGDGQPNPIGRPGLRDWKLVLQTNGSQRLEIEFQNVFTGRFTVLLKLIPRHGTSVRPVLRMPHATQVTQSEAYSAIRLRGLTVEGLERIRAIDFSTDEVLRRFGMIPELALDRSSMDRVFQRTGPLPELRPVLRLTEKSGSTVADGLWAIGNRADFEGQIRFTRPATVPFFEFDWPTTATIVDLRAPGLLNWSRVGNHVQVWFRKPTRDASIRWTGSLANYTPSSKQPAEVKEIELPMPTGLPPNAVQTLRSRPVSGWTLQSQPVIGIVQKSNPLSVEESFAVESSAGTPKFVVGSPRDILDPKILETVDRVGDTCRYRSVMTVSVPPGPATQFETHLVGTTMATMPEVQGIQNATIFPIDTYAESQTWLIRVPQTQTANSLTVTWTVNKVPFGTLPEPRIIWNGTPREWSGRTLTLDPSLKVTNGPTGWEASRIASTNSWTNRAIGRWSVAPVTVQPPISQQASNVDLPATSIPTSEPYEACGPGLNLATIMPASGWLAGLALLVWFSNRSWLKWPDQLVGCSILAVAIVGVTTFAGVLFCGAGAVGIAVRLYHVVQRFSQVILR